jgi:signal transduction histidine kinase
MKVLVVDDEKVVRDGCRRVLSAKGYDVLFAENGRQAMDLLAENPVDLMLLDLKMPVMSGEEVLAQVSSQHPEILVIIITGHGTIDTAVNCMKNGAYDFITKPFQIDQFVLTVNRAADKRRLEQKASQFEEENIQNLYDLNLEKSRLRTIINCMANGVFVANRNFEVVLHNPALMRLLEISERPENPVPVDRIIQDRALISTLEALQSGESSDEGFYSQDIKAGKNLLRAISAPATGPDGGIVGSVTVLEDITAFKQLDAMKTDFVNMVAHELRSPLSAIRQQNSVLLEGLAGPLSEKQEKILDRGLQKIDQLLKLINDLLDIAKIEAGQTIHHRIPVDIGHLLEEAVTFMKNKAEERGIRLITQKENLQPTQADPQGIEEILNNLITNAINYSPNGGEVTVSATGMHGYLEIKISDNGVGIPEEELPKIFDKFYRVKDSRTREVMGTGLGLAIVKGIVESHQGTIDVESIPDKGTTFRILLPIIPSNA